MIDEHLEITKNITIIDHVTRVFSFELILDFALTFTPVSEARGVLTPGPLLAQFHFGHGGARARDYGAEGERGDGLDAVDEMDIDVGGGFGPSFGRV